MLLASIVSAILGLVGVAGWLGSRKMTRFPLAADVALFLIGSCAVGVAVFLGVTRVLNYSVIMRHTSDPSGFAAGMVFAGLFFLMSLGVGTFLVGIGLLAIRLARKPKSRTLGAPH